MSENIFGLTITDDKELDEAQCQHLLSENRKYQEVMLEYRCALKVIVTRLENLDEEFSLRHDRNPIENIKSRLKSPTSIMNKMKKLNLPFDFASMSANILDVAGVRVVCSFEEDVYQYIDIETCVNNRNVLGGPSPESVLNQIQNIEEFISMEKTYE